MLLLEQFEHLTLHPKNAARLKELVLQLAVQGKLTENWRRQNPEVEPAAELLKRIEAEKAQQTKGKKVKDKLLKPISDDEPPFYLPNSWLWCRLGEIIHISSGNGLTSREMAADGTIPVYGGNGINGYHDTYNVEEETIVIGRVGFYCGSIHLTQPKAWVTDNAFVTTFSQKNIDRDFLVWLLKATNLKEDENATAQPVISGRKVYPILTPLPPLAEQEAIVSRVEDLMQKIEELEQQTAERIQLKQHLGAAALQQLTAASDEDELEQNWLFLKQHFQMIFDEGANVKKLRETILQLAVQGKLTATWRTQNPTTEPASELLKRIQAEKAQLVKEKKIKKEKPLEPISEDEVPYILPEGWVWCRMGEACLKITDGTHHSPPNIQVGAYKYVTAKNIKNQGIELSNITYVTEEVHNEIYSRCNPEKGDILYIKDGATTGVVTVNNLDEPFSMLSSVALLKLPYHINNKYLMYLMRSPFFYQATRNDMAGIAITRVTLSKITSSLVPLPPLHEQEAIAAKVDQLMRLCDELEQQLQQSKQETEALMQAVVQEAFQVQEEAEV